MLEIIQVVLAVAVAIASAFVIVCDSYILDGFMRSLYNKVSGKTRRWKKEQEEVRIKNIVIQARREMKE